MFYTVKSYLKLYKIHNTNNVNNSGHTKQDVSIYMRAASNLQNPLAYMGPVTDGTTLGYSGTVTSWLY
jgi:hypothetical protein